MTVGRGDSAAKAAFKLEAGIKCPLSRTSPEDLRKTLAPESGHLPGMAAPTARCDASTKMANSKNIIAADERRGSWQ
jgi:hypothetical protein